MWQCKQWYYFLLFRYNLDPFQEYKDSDLWDALEKCHIKDTVSQNSIQLFIFRHWLYHADKTQGE